MLILEGVSFIGTCLAGSHTTYDWLGLRRWLNLRCKSISSLWLRGRLWGAPFWLSGLGLLSFSLALTLAIISSACSPCSPNCFHVWHFATPIWARRTVCRLWRYVYTSVDWVMLLGQRSAKLWNLSTKVLIDSLFCYLIARRVGTKISVSSSKNEPETTSQGRPMTWSGLQKVSWTIQRRPP